MRVQFPHLLHKNLQKNKNFERAVTFIFKAEKIKIQYNKSFFSRVLYILLYIASAKKSTVGIFFEFLKKIFCHGCLQPRPQRWQFLPERRREGDVDVEMMEMKWRMRDDR